MDEHARVAQAHVEPEEGAEGHRGEVLHAKTVAQDHDAQNADQDHARAFEPAERAGALAEHVAEHHVGDPDGDREDEEHFGSDERVEILFAFKELAEHRVVLLLDGALRDEEARRRDEEHHDADGETEKKAPEGESFLFRLEPRDTDAGGERCQHEKFHGEYLCVEVKRNFANCKSDPKKVHQKSEVLGENE